MAIAIPFLAAALWGGHWTQPTHYADLWLYVVAIIGIPSLFQLTGSIRWDRFIGELSYPMYMTHILLSWPLRGLHGSHGVATINGALLLLITVLVSIALYRWFEAPIDRWRQARVDGK